MAHVQIPTFRLLEWLGMNVDRARFHVHAEGLRCAVYGKERIKLLRSQRRVTYSILSVQPCSPFCDPFLRSGKVFLRYLDTYILWGLSRCHANTGYNQDY